jgi:hypothetical protein
LKTNVLHLNNLKPQKTESSKEYKPVNPFIRVWRQINSFFGAIGLLSITQSSFQLQPFIEELITFYQTIITIPWKIFPFEVWGWMQHYFFFGLLWFSSSTNAASIAFKDEEDSEEDDKSSTNSRIDWKYLLFIIAINIGFILVWPFYVIWHLLQLLKREKELVSKLTFQWFGSILMYFIFLFILNRMLNLF